MITTPSSLCRHFPSQHSVARILGALDDKIELNRRMNETLEPMARVIFKSWFVDSDPVRAKMDDRKPAGMDATTAALFPDSCEETELGHIPAGWTHRNSSAKYVILCGELFNQTSLPLDTPYIGLEHMPRRSITTC